MRIAATGLGFTRIARSLSLSMSQQLQSFAPVIFLGEIHISSLDKQGVSYDDAVRSGGLSPSPS
jgi:hypothetical protein